MTEEQLADYCNQHQPEIPAQFQDGGWFRIQTVPLTARCIRMLRDDGSVLENDGPSNPVFLCDSRVFVGWRPADVETVKAIEAAKFSGQMTDDQLAAYMAEIDRQYTDRGWF